MRSRNDNRGGLYNRGVSRCSTLSPFTVQCIYILSKDWLFSFILIKTTEVNLLFF